MGKIIVIFLLLAKAFDNLLKTCNVLFRKQKTIRKIIESTTIKIGVPQGSVLGPLLFNTYINNLINFSVHGNVISYADDTAVVFQRENWNLRKETAETEFKTSIG